MFNYLDRRERKCQHFDKEKITLKKAGKEFNVYDKIQENSEDTEIYEVLEKYGCIDKIILNKTDVYADFTNFKDLRGLKEQQIAANNMFYSLPLEVRQKFNNDKNIFVKDGEKWLKEEIAAEKAKLEKLTKPAVETTEKVKLGE